MVEDEVARPGSSRASLDSEQRRLGVVLLMEFARPSPIPFGLWKKIIVALVT